VGISTVGLVGLEPQLAQLPSNRCIKVLMEGKGQEPGHDGNRELLPEDRFGDGRNQQPDPNVGHRPRHEARWNYNFSRFTHGLDFITNGG
jgi:hypothetical protein